MKNTLLALIAGLSIAACGGEKLVKNGDRIVFMGSEQPGEQPSIPSVSTSWTTVHGSFAKRVAFTASGYAGSSALENFPVLVRLSTAISGFDYADCPGGANIVFADANDNLLPHEIDTWDESGTSLVWVNVASLAKDAVFYMYFKGTPSAANAPAAAWNANYVGVWHMAEANGDVADATGHGLAAAASVTQTTGDQTAGEGVFGKARINGTGAAFRRLTVPNYNDRGVGDTFTMSGWIRQTAASSEVRLFARKNNWAEAKGWSCLLMDSTTLNIVGASADSANKLVATIPSALDGWVHLAVVFDGTTATVYANGAAGESGAIKAATDSGNNLYFGSNSASNGTNFRGLFDECRLLDAVASADWVKAEYDQSSASFLAAGTVEINENPPEEPGDDPEQPGDDPEQPGDDPEQPGDDPEQPAASGWETAHGSFAKRMTFKASGYAGSSTLENFPVAVRLSTAIKGFDYADCGENGANIVFTDANDALLPHEIDTWDATGTSLVWVNVASLAKDAVFYMYFKGTPSAANAPTAAWNGDYVGVWHMGEASGDVADSTSGGFTASPAGTDKTASGNHVAGEGVFGNGHVNATAAKKATYLKTAAATDFYVGSTFTVSGWVKLSTAPSSSIPVFSNRYGPAYHPGWDVCLASDTTLTVRGASTSDNLSGTLPSSCKDAWVHLTVVYSGSTATVYANGAAVTMSGSFTAASNPNNGTGLSFGGYNTAYYGVSPIGLFDEFRFRKVAATADWVKAEYDQAGTSFLAVGAVETSGVKKPGVTLYIY